jgi:hypothetical protein
MRIFAYTMMSLSLLCSCVLGATALKALRHHSRLVFTRTLAGLLCFLCLYISLIFSLLGTFEAQVVEWVFFRWGFMPTSGFLVMAGFVVSGVNEAYQRGRKDGNLRA